MTSFRTAVATGLTIAMFMPVFTFAQTSTSSLSTLLEQIRTLQAQIVALQQQQQALVQQQQQTFITLASTLKQGTSGEDVKALQALLAADPTLYPEGLITGFFGQKTAEAVKRFQKKHGLEQVGHVGPRTLKFLNELFGEHGMKWQSGTSTATSTKPHDDDGDRNERRDRTPCFINPAGNIVPLGWFRMDDNDDNDEDNKGKRREGDRGNNGDRGKRNDRWIVRPCAGTGTTTPPVVDTAAPIITNAAISSITSTGATASWNTNEVAVSKVYYATTSPLNILTAQSVGTASSTTFHSLALTGLTLSTTYYYVLESKDAANNTATTSTSNFTTTN